MLGDYLSNEVEVDEVFKREFKLEENDFKVIDSEKELHALAILLRTICITEPNTYPNTPGLGLGITNYQFETLDDITIGDIKSKIFDQMDKFVPNDYVKDIIIQKVNLKNRNGKVLGVMFSLADDIPTVEVQLERDRKIILLFSDNTTTMKIKSEIIIS